MAAATAPESAHEHHHQSQPHPIHALFPQLLDRRRRPTDTASELAHATRKVLDSTGTGFVYGTLFGSVLAAVEGARESPKEQRLRGIVHHAKAMVPETAGKIAAVTCVFRAAALALEKARGKRDMYNTLLAAPIAGGLIKARHGPKAALRSATVFGSLGAVVLLLNKAESKVVHHKATPEEMLEEIAFSEEMDDWDWDA